MGLRIFSATGEALNFGGRRLETIARVSWLPVVLILIVNMATVFAYLSVITGRVITFADVGSYLRAQQALAQLAEKGWENNFQLMAMITAGNLTVQTMLIASFMAPLIRYSGLGERPAPGIVKLSFGPDQLRYIFAGLFSFLFVAILILAPIATATFYVAKYIFAALSQTLASFPDPNSLHTIELTTAGESVAAKGLSWIYDLALPMAGAAPFVLLLWLLVFFHFHPRNRPAATGRGRPFLRGVVTLLATAALLGAAYWFLHQGVAEIVKSAMDGAKIKNLSPGPANTALFFGVVGYLLVSYFNLRLYPYPGVAVCRKSMAFGGMLKVSRGWDIIRLQLILILVGLFLFLVQTFVINMLFLSIVLPWSVNTLYQAAAVSTKLVSSGVTAEWVRPLFIWTWNGAKILINLLWIFFSYGVAAGLYGRLYRESERAETH